MIKYKKLDEINKSDFLNFLNKESIRKHLISHPLFDENLLNTWIEDKLTMDKMKGCKIRAILVDDILAGWCGIQYEDEKYEIAIILDENFWGIGVEVFKKLIKWAKELNHKTIFINFLHTRKEYKFLEKIALDKYETELFGDKFVTYELDLNKI